MSTKICFVLAPIGEPDTPTRQRSDQILDYVIRPVTEECGYLTERADEIDQPGIITSQIVDRIVSANMVIADLTDGNPNVFYELALRHAIKRPAIHMIQASQRPAFDLGGKRTIFVDHTSLPSVDEAKTQLKRQIIAAEADSSSVDNPISVAIDIQALRASGNPLAESAARTETMLRELVSIAEVGELRAITTPVLYALRAAEWSAGSIQMLAGSPEINRQALLELRDLIYTHVVTPLAMARRHYGLTQLESTPDPLTEWAKKYSSGGQA